MLQATIGHVQCTVYGPEVRIGVVCEIKMMEKIL